jgi:threonine dehydrogenase-like Zn-dependent dehydrogenase
MKGLVLDCPGEASIRQVEDPTPAQGEVLLQIRRIGLCGSDLNSFRGKNPMVSFPRIPGHEIAATIVDTSQLNELSQSLFPIGTDVTLSPYSNCGRCLPCMQGRTNCCQFNQTLGVQRDGALAEYIAISPGKLFTAKLNLKELCLVEPLTVGFHAVARGRVTRDDTIAIFGCGGVGLGAVAAASFRRARVIAVDVDEAKLALAVKAGAHETINTAREDRHAKLQELTNGSGPDVIIEAIGLPQTFRAAVEEVAFTGRVVYIGYAKEPVAYETRLFVQKELDILGSRNALPENFKEVIAMLEAGRFPVDQAVSHTVSLNDAPSILKAWSETPAAFSKIMIDLD